jgi:hypothetical protein
MHAALAFAAVVVADEICLDAAAGRTVCGGVTT